MRVLYCLTSFWRFRLESKQKEGSSASFSVSRAPSDRVRTLARPLVYPSSSTVTDCSTVSSSTRLVFAWRAFCRFSAAFCCRLFLGGIAESFRTQVTLVKETLSHISGKHAGLRNDVRSQYIFAKRDVTTDDSFEKATGNSTTCILVL